MEYAYRDEDLVLCVKEVGLLSEESEEDNVVTRLSNDLGGYVGSVHRLDRTTGGLMLFARRPDVTAKLSAAIASGEVQKEYLAVIDGVPESPEGTLEDVLFFDRRAAKSFPVKGQRKGAKAASLSYFVLAVAHTEAGEKSLVRVLLHTGRTHQVRVQFATRGLPLCGDGKYGSRDRGTPHAALWSHCITLTHPRTKSTVTGTSLPPATYPWSLFSEQIEYAKK